MTVSELVPRHVAHLPHHVGAKLQALLCQPTPVWVLVAAIEEGKRKDRRRRSQIREEERSGEVMGGKFVM